MESANIWHLKVEWASGVGGNGFVLLLSWIQWWSFTWRSAEHNCREVKSKCCLLTKNNEYGSVTIMDLLFTTPEEEKQVWVRSLEHDPSPGLRTLSSKKLHIVNTRSVSSFVSNAQEPPRVITLKNVLCKEYEQQFSKTGQQKTSIPTAICLFRIQIVLTLYSFIWGKSLEIRIPALQTLMLTSTCLHLQYFILLQLCIHL